jgi:cell division protein FtsZ
MKTVQAFAAKEAFVKYGTVFDENMEDRIRVTVVATGLAPCVPLPCPARWK